jgi:hypothetical protein
MLTAVQLKRNLSELSMRRTKMGGYKMDCHIVADPRIARRPKARNKMSGEALTNESTIEELRPPGDMAGARAMKTSTLSLSVGWMDRVANAWAVPWLKPM